LRAFTLALHGPREAVVARAPADLRHRQEVDVPLRIDVALAQLPQPKPQTKQQPKPQTKQQSKLQPKPQSKLQPKPQSKLQPKPQTKQL
jgi:hypothetical protein